MHGYMNGAVEMFINCFMKALEECELLTPLAAAFGTPESVSMQKRMHYPLRQKKVGKSS